MNKYEKYIKQSTNKTRSHKSKFLCNKGEFVIIPIIKEDNINNKTNT